MSHRINVVNQDSVWEELQSIPIGERSRIINLSFEHYLDSRKRLELIQEIDDLRATLAPVSGSAEAWIREGRDTCK